MSIIQTLWNHSPLLGKVWLITILVLTALLLVISRSASEKARGYKSIFFFMLDKNNKTSLSRFQLFAWSILLIGLVFSIVTVHYYQNFEVRVSEKTQVSEQISSKTTDKKNSDGTNTESNSISESDSDVEDNQPQGLNIVIPASLFLLLGINLSAFGISSTFDTIGSQIAGDIQGQTKRQAATRSPVRNKKGSMSGKPHNFSEIFMEVKQGTVSISRFQNMFITLILLYQFFVQTVHQMGDLRADEIHIRGLSTSFLVLLSISHAGYLGKKFYSKVYPSAEGDLPEIDQEEMQKNDDQPLQKNTNEQADLGQTGNESTKKDSVQGESKFKEKSKQTLMSKYIKDEVNKYTGIEVKSRHVTVPYARGINNSPEQIKANILNFIPGIENMSRLKLSQTIESIRQYTGIGDRAYVSNVINAMLVQLIKDGHAYINIDDIESYPSIALKDVAPGHLILIKNYYQKPVVLVVMDVMPDQVTYSFVCPVHGLHNGAIAIENWQEAINGKDQSWHDISFHGNALKNADVIIKAYKTIEGQDLEQDQEQNQDLEKSHETGVSKRARVSDSHPPLENKKKIDSSKDNKSKKEPNIDRQVAEETDHENGPSPKIRNVRGFDFAVKKNKSQLEILKQDGGAFIGRYYYKKDSWKQLTPEEAQMISGLGMNILAIYEANPTSASYFTYEQGMKDCERALELAEYVGQPENTAIYFTVDYNPGEADYPLIEKYMKAVYAKMSEAKKQYDIGLYGSYDVVKRMDGRFGIKYLWQTMAWSKGQIYEPAAIVQTKNDMQIGSMVVDENKATQAYGGFKI